MKYRKFTAGEQAGEYVAESVTEENIQAMAQKRMIKEDVLQTSSESCRQTQVPLSDCEDEVHVRVFKKKPEKMALILSSTGNPDHGQNPGEQLFGCEDDHLVIIRSFQEASVKCMDFIRRNTLGSGNWSGGQIYDDNGSCIAAVSYNGRVWDSKQREII